MTQPDWIQAHPVSRVQWVLAESVSANDYNPNNVAPRELELLEISIRNDGFTQPIVVWEVSTEKYEVIDGYHRHLVGKKLGLTHLPVVVINQDRSNKRDRISSTIRHNRARGKHQVIKMSEIVQELSRLKWKDEQIATELGMDPDEVLRLKQISGLAEAFRDKEFSEAWEVEEIET